MHRQAGEAVWDEREVSGKEKGVLGSTAVVYVFIRNVKEMQANEMT